MAYFFGDQAKIVIVLLGSFHSLTFHLPLILYTIFVLKTFQFPARQLFIWWTLDFRELAQKCRIVFKYYHAVAWTANSLIPFGHTFGIK